MNNYRRLFEQISPSESDEELIRKAMARKAENMKDNNTTKRFVLKKAVIIPAAAILAVGTATLSVGAATNWNYGEAFRNLFAQSYEGNVQVNSEVQKVELPTSESSSQDTTSIVEKVDYVPEKPIGTFDFEKYGKALDTVIEGDGVTATLNGLLAYDSQCLIMYTLTATDEAIENNGGEVPILRIDFGNFGFKIDGKMAGGMGYSAEIISEEGNTVTGLIKVHYSSVDLSGKTLNITFLSESENGTILLKEEKDILVDFPIAENIEKELDLELKTDSFDGKITKITVGGFNTTLDFEGVSNVPPINYDDIYEDISDKIKIENLPDNWDAYTYAGDITKLPPTSRDTLYEELKAFGDAVLTLKDGTTVAAKLEEMRSHGDDGNITGGITLEYTYPLNPVDVASITFGDFNITL